MDGEDLCDELQRGGFRAILEITLRSAAVWAKPQRSAVRAPTVCRTNSAISPHSV